MRDTDLKQLIDLAATPETVVEIEVSPVIGRPDVLAVWVNIDGLCRLRVYGVKQEAFSAKIMQGLRVRRHRG